NAFGHAAGMKAVDHAIAMAQEQGIGAVAVTRSSHPGAMASFALHAARQGYIGFAFTHADALLRSHGGRRPYFGTNPVCMAAPRREAEPFCLDMASSAISWNQLMRHRSAGEMLPPGVAADADGAETRDPDSARSLLPAGGYKGYGLAAMVEILCGVMSGMAFGRDIPAMFTAPMDTPRALGQFYMVLRCDSCVDGDVFRARLQAMTDAVRSVPGTADGQVMLAGDPQIREAERRRREGIPLDPATFAALSALARDCGVHLEAA